MAAVDPSIDWKAPGTSLLEGLSTPASLPCKGADKMTCIEVDHIAVTVESLRQAENLYHRLFGLNVLFREGRSGAVWSQWPAEWGWDRAKETDTQLECSCLEREGFRVMLLLRRSDQEQQGRIDYVCLRLKAEEAESLRLRAGDLGCRVDESPSGGWIIEDPYGVRWRLTLAD